jgi:hypothetical protein
MQSRRSSEVNKLAASHKIPEVEDHVSSIHKITQFDRIACRGDVRQVCGRDRYGYSAEK